MANMHVLQKNISEVEVVFHVAIPGAGVNSANVQWRTALVNSGVGGETKLPTGDGSAGTISAAELAQIQAGALYEVTRIVRPDTVQGNLATYMDSLFATVSGEVLPILQDRLKWFGYTR